MFALKQNAWKRVRAITGPNFSMDRIKTMQGLIQESLDFLIHNMEVMSINGYPVDVKKYFGAFAMDVISSCAFGTKVNSIQCPDNEIVLNIKKIARQNIPLSSTLTFLFPSLSKSFRLHPFDKLSLRFLRTALKEVITKRKADNELHRNDFVQLLIGTSQELDGNLTDDEIVDQCLLFIANGYETTSAALISSAYCLATNPECQEKLLNEIDLMNLDDLDFEALQSLPYLEAFLSEVLRLMPPIPK